MSKLVEKYQCPGCVCGSDTSCGKFDLHSENKSCESHVAGTSILGVGHVMLGMPKGFNRTNRVHGADGCIRDESKGFIWFFSRDEHNKALSTFDHLNVPVWAMEKDGDLFVRVLSPRIGMSSVAVIEGGKIEMLERFGVHDVSKFIDDID